MGRKQNDVFVLGDESLIAVPIAPRDPAPAATTDARGEGGGSPSPPPARSAGLPTGAAIGARRLAVLGLGAAGRRHARRAGARLQRRLGAFPGRSDVVALGPFEQTLAERPGAGRPTGASPSRRSEVKARSPQRPEAAAGPPPQRARARTSPRRGARQFARGGPRPDLGAGGESGSPAPESAAALGRWRTRGPGSSSVSNADGRRP